MITAHSRVRADRALIAGAATLSVAAGYWAVFGSSSQLFGRFPYRGNSSADRQRVALTFDDGPNEPWTSRLLDVLGQRGVRATFFQVGRCAERFPAVTRRVVDEGHRLGNHSYGHAFGRYLTQPRQVEEIALGRAALARIAGVEPLLYRPPWLCHPPWVLSTIARSGASPISGTFGDPLEILQLPASWISSVTAARTAPGSIMIMHDGRESRGGPREQTVNAVSGLIDRLRDRGFEFVTVDELLGVPAYA